MTKDVFGCSEEEKLYLPEYEEWSLVPYSLYTYTPVLGEKEDFTPTYRSQVTSWFLWQTFSWLNSYVLSASISIIHLPEVRSPHTPFG